MKHIFDHARKLGFRTVLRITPEVVLRMPSGKAVPRKKAIEFLRELASLGVEYRPTYLRNKRGFTEIVLTPLATVGNGRRKHREFHKVWTFLKGQRLKPVKVL